MKISIQNGISTKCCECGFNHYIKKCESCGKEIKVRDGKIKFCSNSCGRKGKITSKETKLKISKSLLKMYKKKKTRKNKLG